MKERDDFEPSNSNSDCSPVASHSSGIGNSIEQDYKIVHRFLTDFYTFISNGEAPHEGEIENFIKEYNENVQIDFEKIFGNSRLFKEPKMVDSLFNIEQKPQECDTTEVKSMGEPLAQNNTPVKDDWISVEDRLPEHYKDCQVWEHGSLVPSVAHYLNKKYFVENYEDENYMEEGWYYSHDYLFDDYLPEIPLSVTHWRPLPAPPTNLISKPLNKHL